MFQNTLSPPPLKSSLQLTLLFKQNEQYITTTVMESYFSFLKSILEAFPFIYVLKIIQLMNV